MREGAARFGLLLLLLLCGCAAPAGAQQMDPTPLGGDPRLGWSPFQERGGIPRGQALASYPFPGLGWGAPAIGAFWSAGNAAAMPVEAQEVRAELRAGIHTVDGEFRRPLDAGGAIRRQASVFGWQPLGDRSVLGGHVSYDETLFEPGSHTTVQAPHGSSPFVMLDTTTTAHRIQRVRLEGTGGRVLGPVHVGAALGFEAQNGHATFSRVPRLNRASHPAATVGVEVPVRDGSVRIGARARWSTDSETTNLFAVSGGTVVTWVKGYATPVESPLPPGSGSRYQRRETEAQGFGGSLAGVADRWSWVVFGELATASEEVRTATPIDAPADRWDADLNSAGGAVQVTAGAEDEVVVTVLGRWTDLDGRATLAPDDSLFFEGRERRLAAAGELRWVPGGSPWGARGTIEVSHENRDRGDVPPGLLRTSLEGLTTRMGGEVSHRTAPRLQLAGGYWMTRYSASGSAPRPAHFHRGIRRWVFGEIAHDATKSAGHTVVFTAAFEAASRAGIRARGAWSAFHDRPGSSRFELQPTGERGGWSVEIGTILR